MKGMLGACAIMLMMVSCKNDDKTLAFPDDVSNEKPEHYECFVDKDTKYVKVHLFSRPVEIGISVYQNEGLLEDYPAGLVVDESGKIYFFENRKEKEDVYTGSIVYKFDQSGIKISQKNLLTRIQSMEPAQKKGLAVVREKEGARHNVVEILNYKLASKRIFDMSSVNETKISEQERFKRRITLLKKWEELFKIKEHKYATSIPGHLYLKKTFSNVGFEPALVGFDANGNCYYMNAAIRKCPDSGKLEPDHRDSKDWNKPTDVVVIWNHDRGSIWEKIFANAYGPSNDVNALGSRSFFISPSGIIYMMTVTLTHLYIDKYVPEKLAEKVGGAEKAIY